MGGDAFGLEVFELLDGAAEIKRMYLPKATEKATMITGDVDQVADRLVAILKEQGVI